MVLGSNLGRLMALVTFFYFHSLLLPSASIVIFIIYYPMNCQHYAPSTNAVHSGIFCNLINIFVSTIYLLSQMI